MRHAGSHRLFLYTVRSSNWVLKNPKFGCAESENYKKQGDNAKRTYTKLWIFANNSTVIK